METNTREVQLSSTDSGDGPKRYGDSNPLDSGVDQRQSKGVVGIHSGHCEKVGGVVSDEQAGPVLSGKHKAGNPAGAGLIEHWSTSHAPHFEYSQGPLQMDPLEDVAV